jgi:hypothetical protein
MQKSTFFSALARSIIAGEAALEPIASRVRRTLGRSWPWSKPLIRRYLKDFHSNPQPRRRDVVAFLKADDALKHALHVHGDRVRIVDRLLDPARMHPADPAREWKIPAIESVGALADWLQVTPSELEWFADLKGLASDLGPGEFSGPLGHYHYRVLAKDGTHVRLIEAPKQRLKELQQTILAEILDNIPVHSAAHVFRKGRSIQTFTAPHVRQRVVLRLDLQDFFPSITGVRVQAMFRMAGYPESVADLLGGLCTNAVPRHLWVSRKPAISPIQISDLRDLYARPHLPQGAASSPALANISAYRVDCRLAGLAKSADAVYTRYADDLAFSGGPAFERGVERFALVASAILKEEGFKVQHRKTRVMRQSVRQHLAGLVINDRINVVRADFDRLKATLTNCVHHGPDSQNHEGLTYFRAHLEGRVGFVESVNPAKGARLRKVLEQIRW